MLLAVAVAMVAWAAPPPLSPAQRQALRARLAAWQALTPAARNEAREQMQSWLRLPPLQQATLRASAASFVHTATASFAATAISKPSSPV